MCSNTYGKTFQQRVSWHLTRSCRMEHDKEQAVTNNVRCIFSTKCRVCSLCQTKPKCLHVLDPGSKRTLGHWTTGCPKKITLLKFIYNWTKNKKVLRQISPKHDTALSPAGQSVGAGAYKLSCFAYNFLKTFFNFDPIINEFQKSNFLGHPVYAIHCDQSYFVTPPVTFV